MAEEKKSFVLYADIIHMVKKLPKEKQGELFMLILEYVNDTNPEIDDVLLEVAFEPIKQSLKRDLKKYENKKSKKTDGAKIGNLKRWHIDLYDKVIAKEITIDEAYKIIDTDRTQSHSDKIIANIAVSDSVSVSVSDSVIDDINIIYNKFVDEVKNGHHQQWAEETYMRLKLKKGTLSTLIDRFRGQLVVDSVVHKTTLKLRTHLNNWLNKQNEIGKLKEFKIKT